MHVIAALWMHMSSLVCMDDGHCKWQTMTKKISQIIKESMRSVHAISISFNNVTKISHLVSHDRARKFPRATKQPNGPLICMSRRCDPVSHESELKCCWMWPFWFHVWLINRNHPSQLFLQPFRTTVSCHFDGLWIEIARHARSVN